MDFGNNLNWDLVLRTSYEAQLAPETRRGFLPIPTKIIEVDKYTLAIGVASTKAKPTWRRGAFIAPRLLFSVSSTSEYSGLVRAANSKAVFLNQLTLVQFEDFGLTPYALEISIPFWIAQLSIEVWKYQGVYDAEPVHEQIAEVRNNLSRIESKIDNQAMP